MLGRGVLIMGVLGMIGSAMVGSVRAGEEPRRIPYDDPARVAAGQVIYADHCAACHGLNREGQANWRVRDADGYLPAPPHDITGHTWHHSDAQLLEIVERGTEALAGAGYKSRMAGYTGVISDQDILDVLAYIKANWPRHVIRAQGRLNPGAKAVP